MMFSKRFNKLIIISFSMISILILMFLTVDPEIQYTVDEVMSDPIIFENENLFIRGEVENSSLSLDNSKFVITGNNHIINVDYSGASLPEGFHEGLTIAVKGNLVKINNNWTLLASEVITGCPSKYETIDNV